MYDGQNNFFIFVFIPCRGASYSYFSPLFLSTPNQVFIYSTCFHIYFLIAYNHFFLSLTLSSIFLCSYFICFLEHLVIIYSLNISKLYTSILSLINSAMFVTLKFPLIYSPIQSNMVTLHVHFNTLISATCIMICFFFLTPNTRIHTSLLT